MWAATRLGRRWASLAGREAFACFAAGGLAVEDCQKGSILATVDDGSRGECGGMAVVAGMTVLRVTMRLSGMAAVLRGQLRGPQQAMQGQAVVWLAMVAGAVAFPQLVLEGVGGPIAEQQAARSHPLPLILSSNASIAPLSLPVAPWRGCVPTRQPRTEPFPRPWIAISTHRVVLDKKHRGGG
jgi:hypothetical protein